MSPFQESWLTAYLDNELSPEERRIVEETLEGDASLRAMLADLREVRSMLQSLQETEMSIDLTQQVLAFVESPSLQPASVSDANLVRTQVKHESITKDLPTSRKRSFFIYGIAVLAASILAMLSFTIWKPENLAIRSLSPTESAMDFSVKAEQLASDSIETAEPSGGGLPPPAAMSSNIASAPSDPQARSLDNNIVLPGRQDRTSAPGEVPNLRKLEDFDASFPPVPVDPTSAKPMMPSPQVESMKRMIKEEASSKQIAPSAGIAGAAPPVPAPSSRIPKETQRAAGGMEGLESGGMGSGRGMAPRSTADPNRRSEALTYFRFSNRSQAPLTADSIPNRLNSNGIVPKNPYQLRRFQIDRPITDRELKGWGFREDSTTPTPSPTEGIASGLFLVVPERLVDDIEGKIRSTGRTLVEKDPSRINLGTESDDQLRQRSTVGNPETKENTTSSKEERSIIWEIEEPRGTN